MMIVGVFFIYFIYIGFLSLIKTLYFFCYFNIKIAPSLEIIFQDKKRSTTICYQADDNAMYIFYFLQIRHQHEIIINSILPPSYIQKIPTPLLRHNSNILLSLPTA